MPCYTMRCYAMRSAGQSSEEVASQCSCRAVDDAVQRRANVRVAGADWTGLYDTTVSPLTESALLSLLGLVTMDLSDAGQGTEDKG